MEMLMEIWMLVVGPLLLLLVAYDAIATTLSIGTAAGPLTSRIGAAWWQFVHWLARRPDSPWTASAGPVVLLLTIGTWLALLWGGWTLVFAADPEAVVSSATREPAAGWSRLYYAGFTAFTLGIGDYVPNGATWEVLTSVATLTGLGLTTMAITYLVPVVNAVTARRVQANTIAGMGSTPQELVVSSYTRHGFSFLDHRLPDLSDDLLHTAERHLAYPVLHYFHSSEAHVDLRIQARLLDEAVTILQYGLAGDAGPHPAVLDSVRHAIIQLVERAMGEPASGVQAPPLPALGALRDAGIATVDDQTFAQRAAHLSDHRRRVLAFAGNSRWELPTDPTSS